MSAQLKLQPTPKIECSPEEWDARVDLACLYRIVSHLGWHKSIIYNHISMRVPGPEVHFLLNPLGLMYTEITASNLLKVDLKGRKVNPSPYPVRAQLGASRARRREMRHPHAFERRDSSVVPGTGAAADQSRLDGPLRQDRVLRLRRRHQRG